VRRCDKPLPDDATLDDNYLVDVIGQMINVTQVEDVPVSGKDTKKVTVELRNEITDIVSDQELPGEKDDCSSKEEQQVQAEKDSDIARSENMSLTEETNQPEEDKEKLEGKNTTVPNGMRSEEVEEEQEDG
ncbi:unnamed protein product, partial [Arabidopsis halleri]